MRSMEGGGYPGAGSALLKSASPDAVEDRITELIQGNRQASVQISDRMSFPVVPISADAPMKAVAEILRQNGFTGVPVVKDGQPVGILSRRDFSRISTF